MDTEGERSMKLFSAVLAGALLTLSVPAYAQSLGELAKREQQRKKAQTPAVKTYTNDDLKQLPPPTGTPGTPAKPVDGAAKAATAKPGDAKPAEPEKVDATKPAEPAKDEAYWRGRITAARE